LITSPTRVLILALIARLSLETLVVGAIVRTAVGTGSSRRCLCLAGFGCVISRTVKKWKNSYQILNLIEL
jgi:hypothetical protein